MLLADLNTSNTSFKYDPFPRKDKIVGSVKIFPDENSKFIIDPSSYKFQISVNHMLHYTSKHASLIPYLKELKTVSNQLSDQLMMN